MAFFRIDRRAGIAFIGILLAAQPSLADALPGGGGGGGYYHRPTPLPPGEIFGDPKGVQFFLAGTSLHPTTVDGKDDLLREYQQTRWQSPCGKTYTTSFAQLASVHKEKINAAARAYTKAAFEIRANINKLCRPLVDIQGAWLPLNADAEREEQHGLSKKAAQSLMRDCLARTRVFKGRYERERASGITDSDQAEAMAASSASVFSGETAEEPDWPLKISLVEKKDTGPLLSMSLADNPRKQSFDTLRLLPPPLNSTEFNVNGVKSWKDKIFSWGQSNCKVTADDFLKAVNDRLTQIQDFGTQFAAEVAKVDLTATHAELNAQVASRVERDKKAAAEKAERDLAAEKAELALAAARSSAGTTEAGNADAAHWAERDKILEKFRTRAAERNVSLKPLYDQSDDLSAKISALNREKAEANYRLLAGGQQEDAARAAARAATLKQLYVQADEVNKKIRASNEADDAQKELELNAWERKRK